MARTVQASYTSASSSGSGDGNLMSKIRILKVDEEDHSIPLAGAEFKITNLENNSSFTLTTDARGEATSGKLVPGKYSIVEVTAPTGYELDSTPYEVTVTEDEATIKTITNKKALTSVSGTKTWKDENDRDGVRPKSVTVNLLADGADAGQEAVLNKGNKWTKTWSDLPAVKDGKKIRYTVKEIGTSAAGYTVSINDRNQGNMIITNTCRVKPGGGGPDTGDRTNLWV